MYYWYFLGTLYLIYLTYQDYTKKMMVDDRYNYFMMGATVPLYFILNTKFTTILALILVVIAVSFILSKTKAMGEADVKSIAWSILGFGAIELNYTVVYLAFFLFTFLVHHVVMTKIFKYTGKVQGYPIVLLAFIATVILIQVLN